jgi:hypothetical protein
MLRKWYKRILWGLLGLVLASLAGYALLPWYLPKGLIKDKLREQLEQELGREVSIGNLHLSWGGGVEIEDLIIKRREGFGEGDLAWIERVHSPFDPVELAKTGPREVLLEGAHFYVVATEEGINISDLPDLELEFAQVKITSGALHLVQIIGTQGEDSVFDIKECEIFKDMQQGGMIWSVEAQQQGAATGKFLSEGRMGQFTETESTETVYGKEQLKASVKADDLDLGELKLEPWINLWFSRRAAMRNETPTVVLGGLNGKCSLDAEAVITDEGMLQISGMVDMREVKLTGAEGAESLGELDKFRSEWAGSFDPVTHETRISELTMKGPGLELKMEGFYDPRLGAKEKIRVEIKDGCLEPEVLLAGVRLGELQKWQRESSLESTGALSFAGVWTSGEGQEKVRFSLEGTQWDGRGEGWEKRAGEALQLQIQSEFNRETGRLVTKPVQFRWGPLRVEGEGELGNWYELIAQVEPTEGAEYFPSIIREAASGKAEVKLEARVDIDDSKKLSESLSGLASQLEGLECAGPIHAQLKLTMGEQKRGGHFNLDLPEATSVRWIQGGEGIKETLFEKLVGPRGSLKLEVYEKCSEHRIGHKFTGQLGSSRVSFEGEGQFLAAGEGLIESIQKGFWKFDAQTDKLEEIVAFFPGILSEQGAIILDGLEVTELKGKAGLGGTLEWGELGRRVGFWVEGGGSSFLLRQGDNEGAAESEERRVWDKSAGSICRLQGQVLLSQNHDLLDSLFGKAINGSSPTLLQVEKLDLEAVGCRVKGTGEILWQGSDELPIELWPGAWREVKLDLEGQINLEGGGQEECPKWAEICESWGLGGMVDFAGRVRWDKPKKELAAKGEIDFSKMAFQFEGQGDGQSNQTVKVHKPAGEQLQLDFELKSSKGGEKIELGRVVAQAAGNEFILKGEWERTGEKADDEKRGWSGEMNLTIKASQIEGIARWVDALEQIDLEGEIESEIYLTGQTEPEASVQLQTAKVTGRLGCILNDTPVSLAVKGVEVSTSRMTMPEAEVKVGDNQLTLIAEVNNLNVLASGVTEKSKTLTGRIDVLAEKIDLDELKDFSSKLDLGKQKTDQATNGHQVDTILDLVQQFSLAGECEVRRLSFTDAKTEAQVDLDEWRSSYGLENSKLYLQFRAGLAGGTVEGESWSDLSSDTPMVWYEQTVRQIEATEKLRPLVESEFPGMEVKGRISEKKKLQSNLGTLLKNPDSWQGSGTTTCNDGLLFGPGGPEWMLKVFPGLQLVEYNWIEMTNEFELLEDGRKKNRMLFTGEVYNIYIDGISRTVRDPNEYAGVITALEKDIQASQKQIALLEAGEIKYSQAKSRHLRQQTAGLERLWQRHQAGDKLRVSAADYVTGGLISRKGKEKFSVPREILRIPIFRSHSYVVGRYMVGMETSSLPFGQRVQARNNK